jgi:putative DNA primase/helicase
VQPDNIIIGPGGTAFTPVKGAKPLNGKASPLRTMEPSVILKSAAEYTPEPIDWLWRDWLAKGKLHLLAGAPGTGKTTIGIALAAAITSGGKWPDGTPVDAGDVLIWSGEDGISDTLLPRFLAAGGNKDRLHFVAGRDEHGEARPFDPSTDMPKLYGAAKSLSAIKLLLLDPVVAAVAADSHKNTEVRRGLQPVVDLAERLQCAVLGITHLSKNTSGREPLERIAGSIAFGAVARVALATVRPADQDAPRRLVRAKSNIGPDTGGFEYTLFSAPVPGFGFNSQTVEWGQMLEGTARELMAVEQPGDDGEAEDAEEFLADTLRAGPTPTREIKEAARAHGLAWRTIERAKRDLGIQAVKLGMKEGWAWEMPALQRASEDRHEGAEDRHKI